MLEDSLVEDLCLSMDFGAMIRHAQSLMSCPWSVTGSISGDWIVLFLRVMPCSKIEKNPPNVLIDYTCFYFAIPVTQFAIINPIPPRKPLHSTI